MNNDELLTYGRLYAIRLGSQLEQLRMVVDWGNGYMMHSTYQYYQRLIQRVDDMVDTLRNGNNGEPTTVIATVTAILSAMRYIRNGVAGKRQYSKRNGWVKRYQ
jgi:hypothetical protein